MTAPAVVPAPPGGPGGPATHGGPGVPAPLGGPGVTAPLGGPGVTAPAGVEVAARLRQVVAHLGRRLSRAHPEAGVTPSRLVALGVLEAAGPLRIGALAEHLGTSAPTVSRLVEVLHELGLVARTPDPDDHRATRVGLTPQGLVRLCAQRAAATDEMARRIDALPADRRAVLVAALPVLEEIVHP